MNCNSEITHITEQFIAAYKPQKLILFGSLAKGKATAKSDIDLCVIAETADKRQLLTDMYLNIESSRPFDLLLYTPEEWAHTVIDCTSFAYKINKEGLVLYGGQH